MFTLEMVKIIKQTYGPWSNEENKVISNAIASGIIGKNWSQKEANRINHLLKKRSLRQIAAHLKEIQKKIDAEKTAEKITENKPSVLPDYGWIYFASNLTCFIMMRIWINTCHCIKWGTQIWKLLSCD